MERSYTVAEIDELRRACRNRIVWGTSVLPTISVCSGPYYEEEVARKTEDHVRTCMLAGITAEDLYKEDEPRARAMEEFEKERQAAASEAEGHLVVNFDNVTGGPEPFDSDFNRLW